MQPLHPMLSPAAAVRDGSAAADAPSIPVPSALRVLAVAGSLPSHPACHSCRSPDVVAHWRGKDPGQEPALAIQPLLSISRAAPGS